MEVKLLPTINACLNGLAGVFLLLGWRAIRSNNPALHQRMMVSAFLASGAFLITYVTYHVLVPGVTRYQHEGVLRVIYFFILLTHTPLAVLIVPFILRALWLAYKKDFTGHKKITIWLLPVWLYVSVTGVLIYLMLYIF